MSTETLAALQQQLQQAILSGTPPTGLIRSDRIAEPDFRFQAYNQAYRLRLIEVLGNDYPLLKRLLGEGDFDTLARQYLDEYPSDTPSVRWMGRHLERHLRSREVHPALADIAAFEWAQGEAFDAEDTDVLTMNSVAALPPEAWERLHFEIHPSARILQLHWNVPELASADADADLSELISANEAPRHWVMWRRGHVVHWRSLQDDEATALSGVGLGQSFPQICERLCAYVDADQVALHTVSLLKRWLADELLAAIHLDAPQH